MEDLGLLCEGEGTWSQGHQMEAIAVNEAGEEMVWTIRVAMEVLKSDRILNAF